MTQRKPGVCWSCSNHAMVRPRKFWLTGLVKPLCPDCEKQFALCKLPKRKESKHDPA